MRARSEWWPGVLAMLVVLGLGGAPAWADVADDTAPPADGGSGDGGSGDGGDEDDSEDDDDGCGSGATTGASLGLGGLLLLGLRRRG